MKACRYASRTHPLKLILAGPDEGVVRKLQDYSSRNQVDMEYLGEVTGDRKLRAIEECDVYACPSLNESFGLALLEAEAFGKPSVITGVGGQLYAAPPMVTSLYANPDPRDFAAKILALLDDKRLYDTLGKNAMSWADSHAWSKVLPKYMALYERAYKLRSNS